MGIKSEQQNSRTAECRTSGKRTAEPQNVEYRTAEGRRMVFGNAPVISDEALEALAGCRRVLTDEYLDYMGNRYRRLAIGYWTGVSFYSYLIHPETLEAEADRKRCYKAFRLIDSDDDQCGIVVTTTN